MAYRIASFNMYKFNYRSDSEIAKDFQMISKIIKENHFDIVAMQEVLSDSALRNALMPYLPGWECRWDRPRYMTEPKFADGFSEFIRSGIRAKGYSRSKNEAEGYAFLWNTKKFTLPVKKNAQGTEIPVEPRIFNQYRVDYAQGQQPLARNPYYGRFIPLTASGNPRQFEIRLLNTHITYGNSGQADHRKREFEVLASQIYKRISKEDATPWPVYAIMLGDYNLNLNREWTKAPYLEKSGLLKMSMEVFDIIENQTDSHGETRPVNIRKLVTRQEGLSTLKQPDRENFDGNKALANNYDHFTYDMDYDAQKLLSKAYVVNVVQKYYSTEDGRDYSEYKKKISDHLPIAIDFNL